MIDSPAWLRIPLRSVERLRKATNELHSYRIGSRSHIAAAKRFERLLVDLHIRLFGIDTAANRIEISADFTRIKVPQETMAA